MKTFEVKRQDFFPLRMLAASRILFFPQLLLQYLKINIWRKLKCGTRKHDPMYFLVHEKGFRNSYTMLWQQFDAREIDRHVYELDVPLKVRPLQLINRSHRARARARRQYWDSITCSARAALIGYRLF